MSRKDDNFGPGKSSSTTTTTTSSSSSFSSSSSSWPSSSSSSFPDPTTEGLTTSDFLQHCLEKLAEKIAECCAQGIQEHCDPNNPEESTSASTPLWPLAFIGLALAGVAAALYVRNRGVNRVGGYSTGNDEEQGRRGDSTAMETMTSRIGSDRVSNTLDQRTEQGAPRLTEEEMKILNLAHNLNNKGDINADDLEGLNNFVKSLTPEQYDSFLEQVQGLNLELLPHEIEEIIYKQTFHDSKQEQEQEQKQKQEQEKFYDAENKLPGDDSENNYIEPKVDGNDSGYDTDTPSTKPMPDNASPLNQNHVVIDIG